MSAKDGYYLAVNERRKIENRGAGSNCLSDDKSRRI